MSKQRMALFFDGANHSEALKQANVNLDYGKLLREMNKSYWVVASRYYSGLSESPEHKGVVDFLGSLASRGFTLVTKPVRVYPDGKHKANLDVEIAVDIMSMAPRLDHVVLFSGDGDFRYLVDAVQRQGVFVTVCSHKPFCSTVLRDQCNEFLELEQLVQSEPRTKPRGSAE